MSIALTSSIRFPVSESRANQQDFSTLSLSSSRPVRPRSRKVRLSPMTVNLAERKRRTSVVSWDNWMSDPTILAPTAPDLRLRFADAGANTLGARPNSQGPRLAMKTSAPQPSLLLNLQQPVKSGPVELKTNTTASGASAQCVCSATVAPANPSFNRKSLFRRSLPPHRLFSSKSWDSRVAPADVEDDATVASETHAKWPADKSKKTVGARYSIHFTSKVAKKELRRVASEKLHLLRLFVHPRPGLD